MRDRTLRRLIQLFGFWYGCLGAFSTAAWYVSALFGHAPLLDEWRYLVFFSLHCMAACFTFQPHVRPAWEPILSVTPGRIRLAKTLLGLASMNFAGCFGLFLFTRTSADQALEQEAVSLVLSSFLIQNTVYIAAHWAYRPGNLLPPAIIEIFSNPVGSLLRLVWPGKKKT